MTHIGIMQGRLVPPTDNRIQCFPRERWADEFALASQAGLDCIEWIYDLYGADVNPLATDAGVEKLKDLSRQHKVKILSICADYFMDKPLVRASQAELDDRLNTFYWLLERGRLIGINRMVIPFVDASRIDTQAEFDGVVTLLKRVLQEAGKTGIEIHLETSLNPARFAELLAQSTSSTAQGQLRFREQLFPGICPTRGVCCLWGTGGQRPHQGPPPGREHGPTWDG